MAYNHCGVAIRERPAEILMDQSTYCAQVEETKFNSVIPAKSQLRGVLGALQWRAYSTAPQHLVQLSMLQSQVNGATVKVLKMANKLVREVYHNRHMGIRVTDLGGIDPQEVVFVAFSDAAVGNRPDLSSTGGYIICASNSTILEGQLAPVPPIAGRSGRLPRVARSSLSAETQAASEAEEEMMMIRAQWRELLGYTINLQDPAQDIKKVAAALVTDAKSLYDVLRKDDLNSAAGGLREKYSALELLSLSERLRRGETTIRWVNSDAQVVDALTKLALPEALHQMLTTGSWKLVYDPTFTSAKRLKQKKH